jgi:hypothetical protein
MPSDRVFPPREGARCFEMSAGLCPSIFPPERIETACIPVPRKAGQSVGSEVSRAAIHPRQHRAVAGGASTRSQRPKGGQCIGSPRARAPPQKGMGRWPDNRTAARVIVGHVRPKRTAPIIILLVQYRKRKNTTAGQRAIAAAEAWIMAEKEGLTSEPARGPPRGWNRSLSGPPTSILLSFSALAKWA